MKRTHQHILLTVILIASLTGMQALQSAGFHDNHHHSALEVVDCDTCQSNHQNQATPENLYQFSLLSSQWHVKATTQHHPRLTPYLTSQSRAPPQLLI